MKDYSPGKWGLSFIWSLEGSVFPKAFTCALPNALLSIFLWYFWRDLIHDDIFDDASAVTVGQVWSGYNWSIGFMVSFRASRAYARWWEGGTLLQQARGEWFNAYSSLIAFCSSKAESESKVYKFQQTLARLMSMLYACALMSISTEVQSDFEIIDATGLEEDHLAYLRTQPDKCEIIMQWVQRLIVENMGCDVLPIPPPVISRVFQELSRGIVNVHNVRKITEFQFPFPFAQMIMTMLIVQWVMTPIFCGLLVGSPIWACFLSFFPVFACWGLNYIAAEIEQPFGVDQNDMPMHYMQMSMNSSILALLDEQAQTPPDFDDKLVDDDASCQRVVAPVSRVYDKATCVSKMRSVRFVTVEDPHQAHRIRHRFTSGRADKGHFPGGSFRMNSDILDGIEYDIRPNGENVLRPSSSRTSVDNKPRPSKAKDGDERFLSPMPSLRDSKALLLPSPSPSSCTPGKPVLKAQGSLGKAGARQAGVDSTKLEPQSPSESQVVRFNALGSAQETPLDRPSPKTLPSKLFLESTGESRSPESGSVGLHSSGPCSDVRADNGNRDNSGDTTLDGSEKPTLYGSEVFPPQCDVSIEEYSPQAPPGSPPGSIIQK